MHMMRQICHAWMNLEADACIDDTYIYNMLLDPDAFVNDAHV